MLLHSDIASTFCRTHTLELLLWLLGAFLLGYLLRWFLGASTRARVAELEKDLAACRAKNNDLEAELSTAKYEKDKISDELANCRRVRGDLELKLKACMEQIPKDYDTTSTANNLVAAAPVPTTASSGGEDTSYAAYLKADNLQVVEGIGPKIEELLKAASINNWSDLASSEAANISAILEAAGPRYRIHDPKTWAEQARLAKGGKWQELIKYQRFLGGGKDDVNINSGSSKVEKIYMAARGLKAFAVDDLKVVEGIGPKIEGLLKAAGIDSHIELAQTEVSKIKEILEAAGDRYRLADPSTWPKQARMAAEGKWEELKEYQDFLQGGKE